MHIHYNTNQTTLPLEISSFLPQDHLVTSSNYPQVRKESY